MSIIENISSYLGIPAELVEEIGKKAPFLYRRYQIKKKRGGWRHIYHPAKETKALQMAAVDLLDSKELVHDCVMGYVRGIRSPLLKNATSHSSHRFLLRLDFADYFPSMKPSDLIAVCGNRLSIGGSSLSDEDLNFLRSLFFVNNRRCGAFLGIGAPSSPFVSNWIMYDIDNRIMDLCNSMDISYTRYADDLCLSSDIKSALLNVETKIEELVSNTPHPSLRLNHSKRYLATPWSRKRVTGLTITPKGNVKIPRNTKRFIRSLLHHYQNGTISSEHKRSLRGYLAFVNDCEPNYFESLVMKYGASTVHNAFQGN